MGAATTATIVSNFGQRPESQQYQCRLVDPVSDSTWDRIAASHPDSGIFHSSAWARVLCNTYHHKASYLHISRESRTVALLPVVEVASSFTGRRGISLPFSDFCHGLVFEEDAQSFVVNELLRLARSEEWKFFELRGGPKPQVSAVPSAVFYVHEINLSQGLDQLFARLTGSVRGAIRKAQRSGVVTEIGRSHELMSLYYQLHLRTRRRQGLPPQPFKFFLNIQKELIENGLGFVVLARAASRPIAGAVFLRNAGKAIYKYAASDERYQQFRGNDLVLWRAIEFSALEGTQTLNLGRTASDNGGLRRFKLGWDATEKNLHYFRFDVSANSWLSSSSLPGTLHKKVFGRLPLKLNQLAGAMIYPHLD
jgi:hypothetical protein